MSNNKSIRILRGSRNSIADNKDQKLEKGQPLYNIEDNYLTIGDGNKDINAVPITVRDIHGYFEDNNGILRKDKDSIYRKYGIVPNSNGTLSLDITSDENIGINASNTVNIVGNKIVNLESSESINLNSKSIKLEADNISIGNKSLDDVIGDKIEGGIDFTGYVKFNDLSTEGKTTINGSNITTGTIDASTVNVSNLNANNITSGTIDASKINVSNLNADNITTGTIDASSITITGLNNDNFTDDFKGNLITGKENYYLKSSDGNKPGPNDSKWSTTYPADASGNDSIWQKIVTTYANNNSDYIIINIKGVNGKDGAGINILGDAYIDVLEDGTPDESIPTENESYKLYRYDSNSTLKPIETANIGDAYIVNGMLLVALFNDSREFTGKFKCVSKFEASYPKTIEQLYQLATSKSNILNEGNPGYDKEEYAYIIYSSKDLSSSTQTFKKVWELINSDDEDTHKKIVKGYIKDTSGNLLAVTLFPYVREKYTYNDGTIRYSLPYLNASDSLMALWCALNDATKIDGGNIYTHSITSNELATKAIKSLNYAIDGKSVGDTEKLESLTPISNESGFSDTGTFIDLENGNIHTPNFSVIGEKANFKGVITATSGGTIGGFEIGQTQLTTKETYDTNLGGYSESVDVGDYITTLTSNSLSCYWDEDSDQTVNYYGWNIKPDYFKIYSDNASNSSGSKGGIKLSPYMIQTDYATPTFTGSTHTISDIKGYILYSAGTVGVSDYNKLYKKMSELGGIGSKTYTFDTSTDTTNFNSFNITLGSIVVASGLTRSTLLSSYGINISSPTLNTNVYSFTLILNIKKGFNFNKDAIFSGNIEPVYSNGKLYIGSYLERDPVSTGVYKTLYDRNVYLEFSDYSKAILHYNSQLLNKDGVYEKGDWVIKDDATGKEYSLTKSYDCGSVTIQRDDNSGDNISSSTKFWYHAIINFHHTFSSAPLVVASCYQSDYPAEARLYYKIDQVSTTNFRLGFRTNINSDITFSWIATEKRSDETITLTMTDLSPV